MAVGMGHLIALSIMTELATRLLFPLPLGEGEGEGLDLVAVSRVPGSRPFYLLTPFSRHKGG